MVCIKNKGYKYYLYSANYEWGNDKFLSRFPLEHGCIVGVPYCETCGNYYLTEEDWKNKRCRACEEEEKWAWL